MTVQLAVDDDVQAPGVTGYDSALATVAALRAMNLAGEQFRHAVAEHFGIDMSATMAISYLAVDGPLSPHDLANRVGLTPSTVTSLLDRLEHAGYACRSPHPSDRRRTVVTITDQGQQTLDQVRGWMRSIFDDCDDAHLGDIATVLTDVASRLGELTERLHA